jgi:hypothetical protein
MDMNSMNLNTFNTMSNTVSKVSKSNKINNSDFFNIMKIVLLILIFAILGFNIFVLLARGTQWAANLVEKSAKLGIDLTFLGLKDSINITENTLKGSLTSLENSIGRPIQSPSSINISYHPDRTGSDVQRRNKSGYCLVGKDKGFRTCMYTGVNDVCKSGEIYPSMDICKEPTLRQ